jgi:Tol biopolymer transport system component
MVPAFVPENAGMPFMVRAHRLSPVSRHRPWTIPAACLLAAVAATPAHAQITRVSVSSTGVEAQGHSSRPLLSGDGRSIVFVSLAGNLVAGDTNLAADVFVRDVVSGETTRVSVASDGAQANNASGFSSGSSVDQIAVSRDGRFVAFSSFASNLIAGDTHVCRVPNRFMTAYNCLDVFVHDRQTRQTTRVSVGEGGVQSDHDSRSPAISGDGRYVAFVSTATNLVAGDTNNANDLFVHDRQTGATERVSVTADGQQVVGLFFDPPSLSGDGRFIAFISAAPALNPRRAGCAPLCPPGFDVLVRDRQTGDTEMINVSTSGRLGDSIATGRPILSEDGRFVVFASDSSSLVEEPLEANCRPVGTAPPVQCARLFIRDRATQRTTMVTGPGGKAPDGLLGGWHASGDSRFIAFSSRAGNLTAGDTNDAIDVFLHDRQTSSTTRVTAGYAADPNDFFINVSVDAAGTRVAFDSLGSGYVPDDTNMAGDVFVATPDRDADGMLDGWEQTFGLNAADPADAALDTDGDGRTNLDEFRAATHPRATERRYLAEGADNAFFSTRLAFFNPGAAPVTAVVRALSPGGQVSALTRLLPARSRTTLFMSDVDVAGDFASVVESDAPIVVDRQMSWGAGGYGSHAETAGAEPATAWLLAEGATHGRFQLFYLLQNPSLATATISVAYLRPAPQTPVVQNYVIPAQARLTIWVDSIPELAETDVSARIQSDQPILVERAMYMDLPGQSFGAGHAGAGVTVSAPRWFLAEGATGSFFDLYYLIANPAPRDTQVRVTYLLPDGPPIVREYPVARESRYTISVDTVDPRLADTPVSAIVESIDGAGIVVERSMWWPGGGQWQEGHLAAGTTTTGRRWALAEGQVGGGEQAETYVLIANPTSTPGMATITLVPESPAAAETHTIALPANSRVNVPISQYPGIRNTRFATLVESDGPDIVVERAMYTSANGVVWAAGTAAIATRLP